MVDLGTATGRGLRGVVACVVAVVLGVLLSQFFFFYCHSSMLYSLLISDVPSSPHHIIIDPTHLQHLTTPPPQYHPTPLSASSFRRPSRHRPHPQNAHPPIHPPPIRHHPGPPPDEPAKPPITIPLSIATLKTVLSLQLSVKPRGYGCRLHRDMSLATTVGSIFFTWIL